MMIRRVALPISDLAQHLEDVTAIAGALAQRRGITPDVQHNELLFRGAEFRRDFV